MFQNPLAFAAAVVLIGATQNSVEAQSASAYKSFKSESGYAVRYPSSWYRQASAELFFIQNFPPSKAVLGAILPEGGAGIKVLVPSQVIHDVKHQSPKSLDDWVTAGTAHYKVIEKRAFEVNDGQRQLTVVEVKTQCCGPPPYQASLDWYFSVDGRMFLGTVFYWQDDPNVDKLRETLKQIVLSLRTTGPDTKK